MRVERQRLDVVAIRGERAVAGEIGAHGNGKVAIRGNRRRVFAQAGGKRHRREHRERECADGVRNARCRTPERVHCNRARGQNATNQQSVEAQCWIDRRSCEFEKYQESRSEYEIRSRNEGEKTTATGVLERAQPRKTVSCYDRQRRQRGQDVAAELRAGNREKYEDYDEPDREESRRGGLVGIDRSGGEVGVGAHRGPSERHEKNPGPHSANHDRDEKPRAPSVFAGRDVAFQMLVDEEEADEAGISRFHQDEPRQNDRRVDNAAPNQRHLRDLAQTAFDCEPRHCDRAA